MIYLDNNATTKVAPEVKGAMEPFFSEMYGNPSSLYEFGAKARRAIEEARVQMTGLLGAETEREIVFTSGGTESNHTAIYSALKANPKCRRIVTSQVEHSSVRMLCQKLAKEGYEIVSVGVSPKGDLDWQEFEKALTKQTALVSIMWANNETGALFPVERMAQKAKESGILLHVDAVQAIGKLKAHLASAGADYVSISAHKFHGPKGIGALYVRQGAPFFPLFSGGRQERDRRAGTENVPGIIGLVRALKLAAQALPGALPRMTRLRNGLEKELLRRIPGSFVNGGESLRISNTTNITIPGIEAETFLIRLSRAGVAASSGSACLAGALEPSHVLQAMGHSETLALSSLRFSLSRYTTEGEIDRAVRITVALAHELRTPEESEKMIYG